MKSILLSLCIFIGITNTLLAQIPNSGFEDWSSFGNGMTIDDWWCSNDSIDPGSTYFPITRSSDHFPASVGNYSMRLECNPAFPTWTGYGLAWAGGYQGGERPSFPVPGHPNTLCGYYKYFPQNGDKMNIRWILYKNGGVVTAGELLSGVSVSEWTAFEIPLVDNTYVFADSARITITPFNWNGPMLGNSVLYVDNLSFDYLITSITEYSVKSSGIDVFPNAVSTEINVSVEMNGYYKLKIFDASGKTLFITYEVIPADENAITIPVSALKAGLYLLVLQDEAGNISARKFIKN
jgi:hypothetical protein